MENIDFSNSNNIEDVMQQAKDKGLYCVNQNDTSGVYQDYLDVLVKSEELLSIDDPVETPYLSKYEARKQIDEVINKLEATKTIASLEKNKSLMNAMNWRVASLRVKLGGISWDVEEPHNAQIELEQALDYYFPTLATVVNACLNDESDSSESGADTNANPEAVGKSLEYNMDEYLGLVEQGLMEQNEKNKLDDLLPSITNINYNTVCSTLSSGAVDAMKCLNLLGILWAGRVQLKKSFYYMLCVKSIYLKLKSTIQLETGTSHASFGPTPPPVPVYEKVSKEEQIAEIESLYTHNLFYLAQAYGHVGNTKQSSLYCYNTLYRQLKAGLSTNKAILEWCTNCQGLCDFFCAIENFEKAGYILNVCDKLLKTAYNPNTDGNASPIDMSEHNSYLECLANVNRRYVKLDLLCIRNAIDYYEKWTHVDSTFVIDNRIPSNVDMSTSAGLIEKLKLTVEANDTLDGKGASVDALPPPPPASESAVPPVTNDPQLDTHGDMDAELSFQPFPNLDIDPIPFITSDIFNYKEPSDGKDADIHSQNTNINSYGDVKKVFVRAQSRLEAAKKYYVMDGKLV